MRKLAVALFAGAVLMAACSASDTTGDTRSKDVCGTVSAADAYAKLKAGIPSHAGSRILDGEQTSELKALGATDIQGCSYSSNSSCECGDGAITVFDGGALVYDKIVARSPFSLENVSGVGDQAAFGTRDSGEYSSLQLIARRGSRIALIVVGGTLRAGLAPTLQSGATQLAERFI